MDEACWLEWCPASHIFNFQAEVWWWVRKQYKNHFQFRSEVLWWFFHCTNTIRAYGSQQVYCAVHIIAALHISRMQRLHNAVSSCPPLCFKSLTFHSWIDIHCTARGSLTIMMRCESSPLFHSHDISQTSTFQEQHWQMILTILTNAMSQSKDYWTTSPRQAMHRLLMTIHVICIMSNIYAIW